MPLLAWDKVCRHKDSSGLGFSSFRNKNKALLCKWLYRWHADRPSNWNKWIRIKYNYSAGQDLCFNFKSGKALDFLRDLVNTQKSTWLGSQLNHNNFIWNLGNGDMALFWEDS